VSLFPWPTTTEEKTEGKEGVGFEAPNPYPPPDTPPYVPASDFAVLLKNPLWKKFLSRIMFGAAAYEMIGGSLVDAIVFDAWCSLSLSLSPPLSLSIPP
jgi:hypothetical protein